MVKNLIKKVKPKKETTPIFNEKKELVGLIEDMPLPDISKIHHFRIDKDGTYYSILVFEINGNFGNENLGYVKDGLLIVGGRRGAYMFRKGDYLSADYIQEKICPNWSETDARNIQIALESKGLINQRYPRFTIGENK